MSKKIFALKIVVLLFTINSCFANKSTLPSFTWINALSNSSNYNESGASIIALTNSYDSNVYFSNSYPPHVPGARNVWAFDGMDWINLSINMYNYENSAPSALFSTGGSIFIGHYNGLIQQCSYSYCVNVINSFSNSLGVTNIINDGYNLYAGYSDKNTGNSGKFVTYKYGQLYQLSGINSGVGKFTTDGICFYIPTKLNGLIRMAAGYNLGDISPPLANNEYVTVAYYSYNDYQYLYIGTSNANLYKVRLPVYDGSSWIQLNSLPLSNTSSVSDMVLDNNNNLFVGLANLSSFTEGGELFILPYNGTKFVKETNYKDTSSITSMLLQENSVYIGTYGGNIWHN